MEYAIVFPGQGSQKVRMCFELAEQYPEINDTWREAGEILGYDALKILEDDDLINDPLYVQPILVATEVALWRLWKRLFARIEPAVLAGHSLGEYAALVAGGILTFKQVLPLVNLRGKLMQEVEPQPCGMVVLAGLNLTQGEELCKEANVKGGYLTIANVNSEQQLVVSGYLSSCEWVLKQAKKWGVKLAKLLPIRVAAHSPLMKPAAKRLAEYLQSLLFRDSSVPIFSNVDAEKYREGERIKELLVQQMYKPVQWLNIVRNLGVNLVLECGPGKVLSNLIRRINTNINTLSLGEDCERVGEFLYGKDSGSNGS